MAGRVSPAARRTAGARRVGCRSGRGQLPARLAGLTPPASPIPRVARCGQPGPAVAAPGPPGRGPAIARTPLRLVHRGIRHRGPGGCPHPARSVVLIVAGVARAKPYGRTQGNGAGSEKLIARIGMKECAADLAGGRPHCCHWLNHFTGSSPPYPSGGMAPSCCMSPRVSMLNHHSTILPSENRQMLAIQTDIFLPLGGMPINSLVKVPSAGI